MAAEQDARKKAEAALQNVQRELAQLKDNTTDSEKKRELDKQTRKLEADLAQARADLESEQKNSKKMAGAKTKQELQAANNKVSE